MARQTAQAALPEVEVLVAEEEQRMARMVGAGRVPGDEAGLRRLLKHLDLGPGSEDVTGSVGAVTVHDEDFRDDALLRGEAVE